MMKEPEKTCKRCHRNAARAGTPILGDVCGDCADDLRGEEQAREMDPDRPQAATP